MDHRNRYPSWPTDLDQEFAHIRARDSVGATTQLTVKGTDRYGA